MENSCIEKYSCTESSYPNTKLPSHSECMQEMMECCKRYAEQRCKFPNKFRNEQKKDDTSLFKNENNISDSKKGEKKNLPDPTISYVDDEDMKGYRRLQDNYKPDRRILYDIKKHDTRNVCKMYKESVKYGKNSLEESNLNHELNSHIQEKTENDTRPFYYNTLYDIGNSEKEFYDYRKYDEGRLEKVGNRYAESIEYDQVSFADPNQNNPGNNSHLNFEKKCNVLYHNNSISPRKNTNESCDSHKNDKSKNIPGDLLNVNSPNMINYSKVKGNYLVKQFIPYEKHNEIVKKTNEHVEDMHNFYENTNKILNEDENRLKFFKENFKKIRDRNEHIISDDRNIPYDKQKKCFKKRKNHKKYICKRFHPTYYETDSVEEYSKRNSKSVPRKVHREREERNMILCDRYKHENKFYKESVKHDSNSLPRNFYTQNGERKMKYCLGNRSNSDDKEERSYSNSIPENCYNLKENKIYPEIAYTTEKIIKPTDHDLNRVKKSISNEITKKAKNKVNNSTVEENDTNSNKSNISDTTERNKEINDSKTNALLETTKNTYIAHPNYQSGKDLSNINNGIESSISSRNDYSVSSTKTTPSDTAPSNKEINDSKTNALLETTKNTYIAHENNQSEKDILNVNNEMESTISSRKDSSVSSTKTTTSNTAESNKESNNNTINELIEIMKKTHVSNQNYESERHLISESIARENEESNNQINELLDSRKRPYISQQDQIERSEGEVSMENIPTTFHQKENDRSEVEASQNEDDILKESNKDIHCIHVPVQDFKGNINIFLNDSRAIDEISTSTLKNVDTNQNNINTSFYDNPSKKSFSKVLLILEILFFILGVVFGEYFATIYEFHNRTYFLFPLMIRCITIGLIVLKHACVSNNDIRSYFGYFDLTFGTFLMSALSIVVSNFIEYGLEEHNINPLYFLFGTLCISVISIRSL